MHNGTILISFIILMVASCGVFSSDEPSCNPESPAFKPDSDIWVGAYMGAWNHYAPPGGNWGHLPTEEIDWEAFTHMFYFSLLVNRDGTLSPIADYHNFSPDRISSITVAAHNHQTPVLFTVGGWGNYEGFSSAIRPENRQNFIKNLISTLKTWGFDGIDLDMEPIEKADVENYTIFVTELRRELNKLTTPLGYRPMLTAAAEWQPEMFAEIADRFDQINLMTYDFSGPWEGWVSWHNAPVYNGGYYFEKNNRPLPSADRMVSTFMEAGVPAEKLGIGIVFYGYLWRGYVTEPLQNWPVPPDVTPNIPYHEIKRKFYRKNLYRWDEKAEAAYLSIPGDRPEHHKFISYDNEASIRSKIRYVQEENLGGVFIWELGGGHFSDRPEGEKDPLLQSVKREALNYR